MHLGKGDLTVRQAHTGNTLTLALTTATIEFAQARQLANARTRSNGLDRGELANDFKVHASIVANAKGPVNQRPNE
jgi:hypothetical protein